MLRPGIVGMRGSMVLYDFGHAYYRVPPPPRPLPAYRVCEQPGGMCPLFVMEYISIICDAECLLHLPSFLFTWCDAGNLLDPEDPRPRPGRQAVAGGDAGAPLVRSSVTASSQDGYCFARRHTRGVRRAKRGATL